MAYLIDTNVLSELRKAHRANAKVRNWHSEQEVEKLWISVISLLEIKIGIVRAQNNDPDFSKVLSKWYDSQLVPSYFGRILSIDQRIAEERSDFEKIRTLPYSDALIAATAVVYGMIVVTRNTGDFIDLGITLINPWEQPLD